MSSSDTCSRFTGLKNLFDSLPLSKFPHPKTAVDAGNEVNKAGVVETTADTRLRDVVSLLLKHNISSCPVRKADHKNIDGKWIDTYCGVVDLLDIVAFVLNIMKMTSKWGKGFEAVLEAVVQFAEHTVSDVMAASPVVAFQPIEESASLSDALKLLGKDRYHRAIVIDPKTERLSNIVTQSSMLEFVLKLNESNEAINAFCSQTLLDLGLGRPQKLITIPLSHKAVDAFHLIHKHRVTGIPVVDSNGRLVGNVSARDIRSMVGSVDKFDRLFDTLSEFLEDIQVDKQKGNNNPNLASPKASTSASSTGPTTPVSTSPAPANGSSTSPSPSPFAPASASPASSSASTAESKNDGAWSLPPAYTAQPWDSLLDVIRQLVTRRIHRVYITDDEGKISSVVTVTDILRVFAEGAVGPHQHPRNSISRHMDKGESPAEETNNNSNSNPST